MDWELDYLHLEEPRPPKVKPPASPPPPTIKRRDPVVSVFYLGGKEFAFQTSSGKESLGRLVRVADRLYMQDENARHLAPFQVLKPVADSIDI